MDFRKYLTTEYDHNTLADIANHGCAGGVSGMIYYSDCIRLYGEFAGDIHEIIGQWCDETGEKFPDYIAKELSHFGGFATACVWFAAEWIAHEVTQGEYIREEASA